MIARPVLCATNFQPGMSDMPFCDHDNDALKSELRVLLLPRGGDDQPLLDGVATLEQVHGLRTYTEVLNLLVGKHFDGELARSYWRAALEHRMTILRPEFCTRAFRPALLDYLSRVAGELEDPRIIDADFLQNITRSSITDGLTGLYCQTYFKNYLSKIITNKRRDADCGFAVLFFDLDNFKQYNDRCGHLCGDETLRRTAEIIMGCLREGDMAARYGGEEFAVYLPLVNRKTALAVAERIRRAIEQEPFPKEKLLDRGSLTISGGVALYPGDGQSMEVLLEAADQHLYRAKSSRNCIYSLHSDRRRVTRHPINSLVEYASLDGALFRPALSQDVSEFGMGIGCETLIDSGTVLSLRLTRPFWPENLLLSATVRQLRRQGDLVFVGLEFHDSLESIEPLLTTTFNERQAAGPGAAERLPELQQ